MWNDKLNGTLKDKYIIHSVFLSLAKFLAKVNIIYYISYISVGVSIPARFNNSD